jgi:hypothetical protein
MSRRRDIFAAALKAVPEPPTLVELRPGLVVASHGTGFYPVMSKVRTTVLGSSSHPVWVPVVMVIPKRLRSGLSCSYHQS